MGGHMRTWSLFLLSCAFLWSAALAHGDDAFTVLAGAGQDTTVVSTFLPETIHVTVGTTVTWRLNGDEIHTVTLLGGHDHPPFATPAPANSEGVIVNPAVAFPTRMPGAPVETFSGMEYLNSGILSHEPPGPDAPVNDTFSVTFTEVGTFTYHCVLHPWMRGTVVVHPEGTDIASHEEVDAAAQEQAEPLLELVDVIREQAAAVRNEPGPNGSTIWYVKAGAVDFITGDPRAAAFEFFPKDLTVEAGDTIVWMSPEFHTVTFNPIPPTPVAIMPQPQEQGPPMLALNLEVFGPVKPSGVYDPLAYYNSGVIGIYSDLGQGWSMTFEEEGTFEYVCALHEVMGMTGTVTVVARQ